MNPWLFFWSPHYYFPLSGGVAQTIDPDINWFFDAISPAAGDGKMEKKAFEVASYGRQLGLIAEVLIDLAEKVTPHSEEARQSLERLKAIQSEIEKGKEDDASSVVEDIRNQVARLKLKHPENYPRLCQEIQQVFAEKGA